MDSILFDSHKMAQKEELKRAKDAPVEELEKLLTKHRENRSEIDATLKSSKKFFVKLSRTVDAMGKRDSIDESDSEAVKKQEYI